MATEVKGLAGATEAKYTFLAGTFWAFLAGLTNGERVGAMLGYVANEAALAIAAFLASGVAAAIGAKTPQAFIGPTFAFFGFAWLVYG